jgi:hypothetical protein
MQQALQIQTQVNQTVVDAIPALRPLLGHRVQMIAFDLGQLDVSAQANATDPLDWPLSDAERGVWEGLPAFRAGHPFTLDSLEESA